MEGIFDRNGRWREYLMEAWGLGVFMISACLFGVLFFHPDSALYIEDTLLANLPMGIAMGLTAVGIILSPWGKRSGAHINPSVTLTFYRLGKVAGIDALFYVVAQFAGAVAGVFFAWLLLGSLLENAAVNFVVTVPGPSGAGYALAAEFSISFILMSMILITTNSEKLMRLTPYLSGLLVASFIYFEVGFSGMSMNPARTFGSAVNSGNWTSWWVYFLAPPAAMMAAAEIYMRFPGGREKVKCAKYHHHNRYRCIFCGKPEDPAQGPTAEKIQMEEIMKFLLFMLVFCLFTGTSCGTLKIGNPNQPAATDDATVSSKSSNSFIGKSGHTTKGSVSLERSGDGWQVVFNSDFDFDGAPAPIVALGKDGYRKETKLGVLKANTGRQVYEIPRSIKAEDYNEVWLWCTMYDVPLGTAKLSR